MNKRIMSLALALMMVLGTFTTVFAADTSVLPEEITADWAGQFLSEKNILKGYEGTDNLGLEDNLTKRDALVLVARLLGEEDEMNATEEEASFVDLTENPYYNRVIAWGEVKGLAQGTPEKEFEGEKDVTAGQYSAFVLRALGHEVKGPEAWGEMIKIAESKGLFEDMETPERDSTLTRGEVAVMTFNALGATMNGSDETLAEHLGIELPKAAKPAELKAKAYTENLKEVVLEVNNADLVDLKSEDIVRTDNYRIVGKKIEKVNVVDNKIVLTLEEAFSSKDIGRKHDLVVRNLDRANKALIKTYEFTVADNLAPEILGAEYLGKYGIKVTMSEPIKEPAARNFRMLEPNGKYEDRNIVMNVRTFGREVILTPYDKEEFNMDTHKELKVVYVEDYAGIKSKTDQVIEIAPAKEGYADAPVVTNVTATGNKLRVTFDKEVYDRSLSAYTSSKSTGNVEYLVRGRHGAFAESVKMITPFTVEYEFNRSLSDRHTTVEILGVKNHDGVAMEKTTEEIEVVLDRAEPVVIKTDDIVKKGEDGIDVTIELTFDKDVKSPFVKEDVLNNHKAGNNLEITKDHAKLFQRLGKLGKDEEVSDLIKKVEIVKADKEGAGRIVRVEMKGLDQKSEYILETDYLVDTTVLNNRMFREYTLIELGSATKTIKVEDVTFKTGKTDNRIEEMAILFDSKLDRVSAEREANYIFTDNLGRVVHLDEMGGRIELDRNGKQVNIIFRDEVIADNFSSLEIVRGIKGLEGEVLKESFVYTFGELPQPFIARINKALKDAEDYKLTGVSEYKTLKDTAKTLENRAELEEALKVVEKAVEDVKKESDKDVDKSRKALKDEIKEAKKVLKGLDSEVDTEATKALEKEIAYSEAIAENDKATKDQLEAAKKALREAKEEAIEANKPHEIIENIVKDGELEFDETPETPKNRAQLIANKIADDSKVVKDNKDTEEENNDKEAIANIDEKLIVKVTENSYDEKSLKGFYKVEIIKEEKSIVNKTIAVSFVESDDLKDLEAAKTEAEAKVEEEIEIEKEKYTDDSVKTFEEAIKKAKTEAETAIEAAKSVKDVNLALANFEKAVEDAKEGLEPKKEAKLKNVEANLKERVLTFTIEEDIKISSVTQESINLGKIKGNVELLENKLTITFEGEEDLTEGDFTIDIKTEATEDTLAGEFQLEVTATGEDGELSWAVTVK